MQPKLTDLLDTCALALDHWGASAQERKFFEESAELTVALTHGESRLAIRGEAVDVILMAAQMLLNACDTPEQAEEMIAHKLQRLRDRVRMEVKNG